MTVSVVEPATEQVLTTLERTSAAELDQVVADAQRAQRAWWALAPSERGAVLAAIATGIEAEAEALARLEARNVGMPIGDARGAVAGAAATFRFYAAAPERLGGRTIPVAGGVDMTFREPLGVVGVITPWNFPLTIASWKIAPALAAGNAVVHKPAELTPLTAIELQRIATAAGLPEGLLSVVVGRGSELGRALVDHPQVHKITLTGSTAVGIEIGERAARQIKRVSLELGGKSPSIVFADADLDAAANGLAGGCFGNAGQDCCARSRVFVERTVLPEFLERLEAMVVGLRVGDPLDEATQMGPLVSARQRASVAEIAAGAPVAFQGRVPDGPGYWFPPTVLHPLADGDRAAREEIFGPVVGVLPFEREDEVIARANDTEYGLSGSIWTADGARALRVARGVQAGALAVNSYTSVRLGSPFGGFKQSGIGRELGADAPEAYTELKNVFYATEA
ncbi:aldehyde dehydrogenase family protein [Patulibacter defluvii]|uniref:aldehyde dehydrogenase family protein n=1 Tax=Patulibacter defluvii TaxID=3095358 RepID=UPI002A758A6C|nr:aldehyde dehydrogenase family protein [Patulibacter sp. DM4]